MISQGDRSVYFHIVNASGKSEYPEGFRVEPKNKCDFEHMRIPDLSMLLYIATLFEHGITIGYQANDPGFHCPVMTFNDVKPGDD